MRQIKFIGLGALLYTIVTFPLAVVWHAVVFEEKYQAFGYFEGDPNFVLGFLTVLLQGLILSALAFRFRFDGGPWARSLKYAFAMGGFLWTTHVLALLAKQDVPNGLMFIGMETAYLIVQFGVFGLALGAISQTGRNN